MSHHMFSLMDMRKGNTTVWSLPTPNPKIPLLPSHSCPYLLLHKIIATLISKFLHYHHEICTLSCLDSFTQHYRYKIHSYCFYGKVYLFWLMDGVPQLAHNMIHTLPLVGDMNTSLFNYLWITCLFPIWSYE